MALFPKKPSTELEELIRTLELRLVDPGVRANPEEMAALLADDFLEYGSSGRTFDKQQVLEALQHEGAIRFSLHDFHVRNLSRGVVLATYRATATPEGAEPRSSLRSSVWVRRSGRWQVTFHQGTLTSQSVRQGGEA